MIMHLVPKKNAPFPVYFDPPIFYNFSCQPVPHNSPFMSRFIVKVNMIFFSLSVRIIQKKHSEINDKYIKNGCFHGFLKIFPLQKNAAK